MYTFGGNANAGYRYILRMRDNIADSVELMAEAHHSPWRKRTMGSFGEEWVWRRLAGLDADSVIRSTGASSRRALRFCWMRTAATCCQRISSGVRRA